jgi:hypothetical protein
MEGSGFLAIWSDLSQEDETDWVHWMIREHSIERVNVPGFLACRVFCAPGSVVNRYLILYELKEHDVVGSAEYLARLNTPTPWSQRIMPRLRNFVRGGGRVVASAGVGQGGLVAALPLDAHPEWDAAAVCRALASLDRIAAARVLLTDVAQTSIQTSEKRMRAKEDSFAALLLIEGFDEASLRGALRRLQSFAPQLNAGPVDELPLYANCFSLHRRLLQG